MRSIVIVNFEKYHKPADREISAAARNHHALRWVRLNVDWHHDPVIAELPPAERFLWPVLIAEAGKAAHRGTVEMTAKQLSIAARLPEVEVRHALLHLRKRGRIATQNVAGSSR